MLWFFVKVLCTYQCHAPPPPSRARVGTYIGVLHQLISNGTHPRSNPLIHYILLTQGSHFLQRKVSDFKLHVNFIHNNCIAGSNSSNTEVIQNPHPSGQNLDTNSLPCPLLGRTWGRWGKTLIGALNPLCLTSLEPAMEPDSLWRVRTMF